MASEILYASSNDLISGARDPLVDVMELLHPRAVVPAPLHAAGRWAVRYEPFPHVKLGLVVDGECWLSLDGREPVLLHEGDFYLLGNPPPYVLGSSPDAVPRAAATVPRNAAGHGFRIGAGADENAYTCSVDFTFDDRDASLLLDLLPPVVLVRAQDPRGPVFMHLASLMVVEIESNGVGRSPVLEHIAQMIFVHMLRAHADDVERPSGWLAALSGDGIGASMRAMHADVARRWTLDELAEISRTSRSTFAASFKERVGTTPLAYLIEWRMRLAQDALRKGGHTLSEVAAATGYQSESAFSTAFRRVVGSSPHHFRVSALRRNLP